ncbi:MarR family transcriptional regulator [Hoyosella rhizosphaerae]|uniref:MarR family transcriptional regulator n=1 Tax=Hoyosella rhizosphaerae TaxID=1755582 RepID=A0A916XFK5_9ACTN|nr:MarR family transcriptional regulator [Hoyosella rhizosphaerae]MBN4925911.1 MarR family transcriptional regulator [Hoyosella rhizosphaerae]GGC66986.1 MarR family transcriptional regulator [Hoyosella rhizosphaerae]
MANDRELLNDPRITLMGLLEEAHAALADKTAQQITQNQLATGEFEALLRLARSENHQLRMSDLAAQSGLTNSGATRLVDRLEARGLVTRQTSPDDRRGTSAVLTEPGLEMVLKVLPGHLEIVQSAFLDGIPEASREVFFDTLRAVRNHIRPEAERGAH